MSTFLELCRDTRQEAGIAGLSPTTVLNQVGEAKRVVDWVRQSYIDIQLESRQWRWLTGQFQFTTIPGKEAYSAFDAGIHVPPAVNRFKSWNLKSVRIQLNGLQDQRVLAPIDYEAYRSIYLTGPRIPGWPTVVSESPDRKLLLGHFPNVAYTVVGEFQKTPQVLLGNNDVPEMPEEYHSLIVWWALTKYGRFESAPEVYQDAKENVRRLMSALRNDQLPTFFGVEALA